MLQIPICLSALEQGLSKEVVDRSQNVDILTGNVKTLTAEDSRLDQALIELTNEVTKSIGSIEAHLNINDIIIKRHEAEIYTANQSIITNAANIWTLSENFRDSELK